MRRCYCLAYCIVDSTDLPNTCVVLHHILPDGSWHHDWLMDRGDGGLLVTFRCEASPAQAAAFAATRTADHRRIYLSFEGPISGNRGEVRRVAVGTCLIQIDAPGAFVVDATFPGTPRQRFSARPVTGDVAGAWQFLSARIGWHDDTTRDILGQ